MTDDPSGYCLIHAKEIQSQQDKARGTSVQRGYNRHWQKERRQYLRENPLCVRCAEEGKVMLATIVDHIIPHRGDQSLFWDKANWQPLCAHHHNAKTIREGGRFGVRGRGYKFLQNTK